MQCNWSYTTRALFGSVAKSLATFRCQGSAARNLRVGYPQKLTAFAATRSYPRLYSHSTSPVATASHPKVTQQLTGAQKSRAAWRAVYIYLQGKAEGFENAHALIDSLKDRHRAYKRRNPNQVSPRLASHALLHAFIRYGYLRDASYLAQDLMKSKVKLRSRTLEAIVSGQIKIRKSAKPSTKPLPFPDETMKTLVRSRHLADVIPHVRNADTRYMLKLMDVAQRTHNGHTNGMYATLICLCLLNGEIIIAALLFGFAMKEFQLRKPLPQRFDDEPSFQEGSSTIREDLNSASLMMQYRELRNKSALPAYFSLNLILSQINRSLALVDENSESPDHVKASTQALAHLAFLLDKSIIPLPGVAPLLRALYDSPRGDDTVWILTLGTAKSMNAYSYLHGVLLRLILSLKTESNENLPLRRRLLDRHSCNSLLHYSLRHRRCVEHASIVLKYMTDHEALDLTPDRTTYNILLRSGTLLRLDGISKIAIQAFQLADELPETTTSYEDPSPGSQTADNPLGELSNRLTSVHSPDAYTMSSYIAHLTSTGKSVLGAQLVRSLFPAFFVTGGKKDLEGRQECINRAASFGPHFLVSLLQALRKSGHVQLARRLWRLIRLAERRSWDEQVCRTPWIAPIQAYTIMLECCLQQTKTVLRRAKTRDNLPQLTRPQRWGVYLWDSLQRKGEIVQRALESRKGPIDIVMVKVPKPDARFFNVLLALVNYNRPCSRKRHSRAHYRRLNKRRQRADERSMVGTLLQDIAADMVKAGFPVPVGIQHLVQVDVAMGPLELRSREGRKRVFAAPPFKPRFSAFRLPVSKDKGLLRLGVSHI